MISQASKSTSTCNTINLLRVFWPDEEELWDSQCHSGSAVLFDSVYHNICRCSLAVGNGTDRIILLYNRHRQQIHNK
jgi:hypothetical protein